MSSWDAAVALLEKSATITAGLLQKNLEISYVQAAHIIDRMIEQKLISRDGSKLKVVKPKKSGPKELAAEHAKQLEEGW
jgi:predicted HTH transcriptional regulator